MIAKHTCVASIHIDHFDNSTFPAVGGNNHFEHILGANLNTEDEKGYTPLHLSLNSGSLEVMETLIKHGATINAKNKEGKTPLKLALEMDRKDMANLLRKYEAKE